MSQNELEVLTEDELRARKQAQMRVVQESKGKTVTAPLTEWFSFKSGLPSQGKTYPEGGHVEYRKYGYDEVLAISNADMRVYDRFKIMFRGIRASFDPLMITMDDFQFIGVQRKLEAFGTTKFSVPYHCPFCDKDGTHQFTLQDFSFQTMEAESLPLYVTFEKYGDEDFIFMPMTIGDFFWLHEKDLFYKKNDDGEYYVDRNGNYVPDVIARLACMCSTSHKWQEAYAKLRGITNMSDIAILNEVTSLLEHGIQPMDITCHIKKEKISAEDLEGLTPEERQRAIRKHNLLGKECGETVSLPIGGDTLILPFREPGSISHYGIRFSKDRDSGRLPHSETSVQYSEDSLGDNQ